MGAAPAQSKTKKRKLVDYELLTPVPPEGASLEAGGLIQAAGLALALLKHTRMSSWKDLADALGRADPDTVALVAQVHVTSEQQDLMNDHLSVIQYLSPDPLITAVVCTKCAGWILMGTGAKPTSCRTSSRCGGRELVKVSAAKKQKPGSEEVADADLFGNEEEQRPEPAMEVTVHISVSDPDESTS